MRNDYAADGQAETDLVPFLRWLRSMGRSESTGDRWVRNGWIAKPLNIGGIRYSTRKSIDEFLRRATAGEFARIRNREGLSEYNAQRKQQEQHAGV